MDRETIAAYDADPQSYVKRWDAQADPAELHARILRHFRPGPTADIGCGSGRQAAWLAAHGFPVVGFDASSGLLAQARALHPQIEFERAVLPDLAGITAGRFDNVICKTVIMHLPRDEIAPSVRRMLSTLKPGGLLYLSWRVSQGADQRDEHGRLYSAFESDVVREALAGQDILFEEEAVRPSGQVLHRLMARAA